MCLKKERNWMMELAEILCWMTENDGKEEQQRP